MGRGNFSCSCHVENDDEPAPAEPEGPQDGKGGLVLTTSTGVTLTIARYNDLLEGERGLWATLKAHGKLVGALMKIRDNAAGDLSAIARDALATDIREIDWAPLAALSASRTTTPPTPAHSSPQKD